MNEDWDLLLSFLPTNWKWLAVRTKALKGMHGDRSPADAMRLLLLHVGAGLSLRETAVRARECSLADISDVGIMKRLHKSKEWLRQLCVQLFRERGIPLGRSTGRQLRVFDATTVKEPGKTGSLWRIHYSVRLPSLTCDFFKITETQGEHTGETLKHFPLSAGDHILADRGYCTSQGIRHATTNQAFLCVRVNSGVLRLQNPDGTPFALLDQLGTVTRPGQVGCWPVHVADPDGPPVQGRLCVVRKAQAVIDAEVKLLKRKSSKRGRVVRPETLVVNQYVVLFTTFPEDTFPPTDVLLCYRMRWQVELVFKRFKQLAQLGHLPKHDSDSSQAWLYGKLFVALLTEKIISHARTLSPWGYCLDETPHCESLA